MKRKDDQTATGRTREIPWICWGKPWKKLDRKRLGRPRFGARHTVRRRVVLSGVGAVLVLAVFLLLPFGNGTPTWAEVLQLFQTVTFFKMTVYEKKDLLGGADRFEYWRGSDGRSRLHHGGQVVFGEGGKVKKAFDVRERKEVAPDETAENIILHLGRDKQFSLETLVGLVATDRDELNERTATVNADPTISHDLVVFELSEGTFWYRVWALKQSRLPVRLLCVDPFSGSVTDVFFTYSKEQPGDFFDPEVFARKLADPSVVTEDLVLGDQHDPLGKPATRSQ